MHILLLLLYVITLYPNSCDECEEFPYLYLVVFVVVQTYTRIVVRDNQ